MDDIRPDVKHLHEIGQRAIARLESGTAEMLKIHQAGKFTAPCWDGCDGVIHYGELVGTCPTFRAAGCLIPVVERERMNLDLRNVGWPASYLEAEWDKCSVAYELSIVGSRQGVLLLGPVGVGKTMAAACLAMRRWPNTITRYEYWPAIVKGFENREAAKEIRTCQALTIDDFGVGEVPHWRWGDIDELFEYRSSRRLTTVVTSNLTKAELAKEEKYRRFVDRWKDLMPHIVTIGGDSRRGSVKINT